MPTKNVIKFLCLSALLVTHIAALHSSALDDLNMVAIIARANGKEVRSLHELCRTLKRNLKPDADLVEAAFQEAAACLSAHKSQLASDDLERLLDSLEESYDELAGAEGLTKGTKHFSNVVVHNALSAGTVFVGGNETIGGNLLVNGTIITAGGGGAPITKLTADAGTGAVGPTVDIAGGTNINTSASGSTVTVNLDNALAMASGTAAAPSYSFSGSTSTGLYSPAANQIAVATNGVERVLIDNNGDVTIEAPTSGVALTVNGVAGSPAARFVGNGTAATTPLQLGGLSTVGTFSSLLAVDTSGNVFLEAIGGSGGIILLNSDSGSASGAAVTIAGGTNINTDASGSTLSVNLDASPSVAGSLTAGTGITATTGNITASAGNISASGSVTAGTSMSAGTTVTAGTGITATTGNIAASAGNISASGTVTAGTTVRASNGTASAPAYTFSSQTNVGMYLPAANELALTGTTATPSLLVDASGSVTYFTKYFTYATPTTNTFAGDANVPFNQTQIDPSHGWNSGGTLWTVPVTGYYLVTASLQVFSASSVSPLFYPELNGTVFGNGSLYMYPDNSTVSGSFSWLVQANAGETIGLFEPVSGLSLGLAGSITITYVSMT